MRNLGLDLLRVIAVLLVIGRHLNLPETAHVGMKIWQQGGWIGVDLFFVLSGFLVASMLFREFDRSGTIDIKRFLIRRGFKIYPAFWVFLAFSLLMKFSFDSPPALNEILGDLFFVQNYVGSVWGHTWSLAVEEHFYLGIAALLALLIVTQPHSPFRALPFIFFVVAVTCLLFRILNLYLYPEYSHRSYLFGTHCRIDSLFFGATISYLFIFHDLEKRAAKIPTFALLVCGCLLLSPAFIFDVETVKWVSVVGVVLIYSGSGLCLLAAARLKSSRDVTLNLLGALGAASYSVYLWHLPVSTWGHDLLCHLSGFDHYFFYLFNAIFGAFAFGWLLSRLIETPALSLRDRIYPSTHYARPPITEPKELHQPHLYGAAVQARTCQHSRKRSSTKETAATETL